jgi:uncharacterized membrane protein
MWWKNRKQEPTPTDYRKTRRKQDRTLLVLVLVVLVVGGTGLIGLIWGVGQAVQGGLCLLAGGALIGGLWLLLSLVEKMVDR